MMSLQEISDRLEIQDLLARYSFAIDDGDFDALDQVFTPDAQIDYAETGGAKGSYPQIKEWLKIALSRFSKFQHMVATQQITFDGDKAKSRTILFNPMVYNPEGTPETEKVFFIGLWYRDEFVRTPDGWRISSRYEEMVYAHNLPDMPPIAPLPPAA